MSLVEGLSWLIAGIGILIAPRIFPGKYIQIVPVTNIFGIKFGARLDWTVLSHVFGNFILCIVHPAFSLGVAFAFEARDGRDSEQGFDLLDFLASIAGIIWFMKL